MQPEPVSPEPEPPHYGVRLTLPEPIGLVSDVQAGLARLLDRLCATLAANHHGARRVRLEMRRVDRGMVRAEIRLARPMNDAARIAALFADAVQDIDAGFGIDQLRLSAPVTEPLAPRADGRAAPDRGRQADRPCDAPRQPPWLRRGAADAAGGKPHPREKLPDRARRLCRAGGGLAAPSRTPAAGLPARTHRRRRDRAARPLPLAAHVASPPCAPRGRSGSRRNGGWTIPHWRTRPARLLEGRDARGPPPVAVPHPQSPGWCVQGEFA